MRNCFMIFSAIIAAVLLYSPLMAQSGNPDYELLAKQGILEYAIKKESGEWVSQSSFEDKIDQLKKLVQSSDFRYRITKLWSWGDFEVVAIEDRTNMELHYTHTMLYLIDKARSPCYYLRLDVDRMEDIISKQIIPKLQINDSVRNALIDLYNVTALKFGVYYDSLSIIQSPTDSTFKIMGPFLDLKYIHKFYNDESQPWLGHWQCRCYKVIARRMFEYWRIIYFFSSSGFRAEKEIMLRGVKN